MSAFKYRKDKHSPWETLPYIKGDPGSSVTIKHIEESFDSDGVNTVTFSDNNILKIRNGKQGVGIRTALIDNNGDLNLLYTDGTTSNIGKVVGSDGISISSVTIQDYELTITLSDGREFNLGNVRGTPGADGKDGVDGKDGTNGVDGKDGISVTDTEINAKGELIIAYSNGTSENLGVVVGSNGLDGTNGIDGKDGISVTSTEINADGELIITYSDGTSTSLGVVVGSNGLDGVDGTNGKDGVDGQDGQDGQDGVGISNVSIDNRGHLILTYTNGEQSDAGLVVGMDGEKGDSGVYIGTDEPTDNSLLWIDYDDETDREFATIVQAVINELPIYNGEVIQ